MKLEELLKEIRRCTICSGFLPHKPRPILQAGVKSKIIIIGQAPGKKVHRSGVPWDDASGKRLREWIGIDTNLFYNPKIVCLLPMGFCFPGKGSSGDLPPRKECAAEWHNKVLAHMKAPLTLLVGQYAQNYYLGTKAKENLTKTVKNFKEYLPDHFPLPHPSPRNNIWLKKNPWFENDLLPILKEKISHAIE